MCFEGWALFFLFCGLIIVGPCGSLGVLSLQLFSLCTLDCDVINASILCEYSLIYDLVSSQCWKESL